VLDEERALETVRLADPPDGNRVNHA
jgi:hypothetical protein